MKKDTRDGFAVVELFTSEGCSSCPPADATLAHIADTYKSNVFELAFHVDYWNNLGWEDIFSSSDYTKRQQEYASVFHLNSIYTPQAVVNGKIQLIGSDNAGLTRIIDTELQTVPGSRIEIHAAADKGRIHVSYSTKAGPAEVLQMALVQLRAETAVKRGENGGHLLKHINIVRDFLTIDDKISTGSTDLEIPKGLLPKDCMIIGFLQNEIICI